MECVVVGTREEASAIREVCWYTGPKAHNLEARTSLGVLGGILERAEVLLANDGGVAHLAAAVGTPVVAVFGPSNDRAWRPLLGTVVAADLPCRPCFYRDFERGKPGGCSPRECMHLVTPAMVVAAARRLLRERRGAA
jgi:heptosyltransferase-2